MQARDGKDIQGGAGVNTHAAAQAISDRHMDFRRQNAADRHACTHRGSTGFTDAVRSCSTCGLLAWCINKCVWYVCCLQKFKAEVYALTKEEGGRHSPFTSSYKPTFFLRTADVVGKR